MARKGQGGRPEYERNELHTKAVRNMAAAGIRQEVIAECIGITKKTLAKHYADVIRQAKAVKITEVANKLIAEALKGNTACMIFFLKTQAGWREKAEEPPEEQPTTLIVESGPVPERFLQIEEKKNGTSGS